MRRARSTSRSAAVSRMRVLTGARPISCGRARRGRRGRPTLVLGAEVDGRSGRRRRASSLRQGAGGPPGSMAGLARLRRGRSPRAARGPSRAVARGSPTFPPPRGGGTCPIGEGWTGGVRRSDGLRGGRWRRTGWCSGRSGPRPPGGSRRKPGSSAGRLAMKHEAHRLPARRRVEGEDADVAVAVALAALVELVDHAPAASRIVEHRVAPHLPVAVPRVRVVGVLEARPPSPCRCSTRPARGSARR